MAKNFDELYDLEFWNLFHSLHHVKGEPDAGSWFTDKFALIISAVRSSDNNTHAEILNFG